MLEWAPWDAPARAREPRVRSTSRILLCATSEKADAAEFRKWQGIVELQFEACYDMTNFDLIVEKIRHERAPMTEDSWRGLMDAIHVDKPHAVNPANWDFHEKSRCLYHYVIMRLDI